MATETTTKTQTPAQVVPEEAPPPREPLKLKGVLDQFKSFDVAPVIGKEFPDAKISEWLSAPDSDDLLKDLAITSKVTSLQGLCS